MSPWFIFAIIIIIVIIVVFIIIKYKKSKKEKERYAQPRNLFRDLIAPNFDQIYSACEKNKNNLTFDNLQKDLANIKDLPLTLILDRAKDLVQKGEFNYDNLVRSLHN